MTNLRPGSLQRRCTTYTAGEGWFDRAKEVQSLQEYLWRSAQKQMIMSSCKTVSQPQFYLTIDKHVSLRFSSLKKIALYVYLHTQRRDQGDPEGWEFSSLIGWKFHSKERSSDTFRRRRWRRKMAPGDRLGSCAIFQLEGALVSEVQRIM